MALNRTVVNTACKNESVGNIATEQGILAAHSKNTCRRSIVTGDSAVVNTINEISIKSVSVTTDKACSATYVFYAGLSGYVTVIYAVIEGERGGIRFIFKS